MHVEHAAIVPGRVAHRDYQLAIAAECLKRNTLVILPTGLGKTVIALLAIAERRVTHPGKVLFLAPTKPLVEQHAAFLRETLAQAKVAVFTGETPPEDREAEWRDADVVCSTPQVVQNDLIADRIDLKGTTLIVFDEAHRASGNYAYVYIAEQYLRARFNGLVLGMTASPGSNATKVREICMRLGIEGIEARTEADADTQAYVQDVGVEWVEVPVPERLKQIADRLREALEARVAELRVGGFYKASFVSKKELLALAGRLQGALAEANRSGRPASPIYAALSAQAAALKANHALELAETQGLGALNAYFERLGSDESKAAKGLLADPRVIEARRLASEARIEHPKLRRVAVTVRQQLEAKPDARIIVFTNYRDMAELLERELAKLDGARPVRFVGQATKSDVDRGLSQKEQVEIVRKFKEGVFNVLVATSVAEEGLDIPATDLVVFYEPVPSEIRSIQRRGRTGRKRAGRVVILMTKGTRDEQYHWASKGKEKRMRREIEALRAHFKAVNESEKGDGWKSAFGAKQATLDVATGGGEARPSAARPRPPERPLTAFAAPAAAVAEEGRAVVIADHREFASEVAKELSRADVVVRPETLETADYVLSDRVGVERKTAEDYVGSLVDGRLFEQVRALRSAYPTPILVIEGDNILAVRKVSPAAIHASLASILTDYRVTVLTTRDPRETADLLAALAKREQLREGRAVAIRHGKTAMSDDERLRFIVEGLPNVSVVLARRLLEAFGTIEAIANAGVDDLARVQGIGRPTAEEIHRVLRAPFTGRARPRAGSAPPEEKR
ncbi:MAG TPA: DEAD/DEAH box helicase [Candidatus Thermoplasmatota archaeon]|nr:DEAD/DEAH box helicase [Candidatus Thermoplasmatota archaeon]